MPVRQRAGAGGAAEQLVHRQPGDLALDVPQRHVDGGDRGHRDRPAAPVGAPVQVLPGVLDPLRVAADQQRHDVFFQVRHDRQLTAVQGRVPSPVTPSEVVIFRVTKLRPGLVTKTSARSMVAMEFLFLTVVRLSWLERFCDERCRDADSAGAHDPKFGVQRRATGTEQLQGLIDEVAADDRR